MIRVFIDLILILNSFFIVVLIFFLVVFFVILKMIVFDFLVDIVVFLEMCGVCRIFSRCFLWIMLVFF